MAKNTVEKHQYGYAFMNCMTGGQKCKTFWATGTVDEAKLKTRAMAESYARAYETELNDKARARNKSHYAPSHIDVRIVGCSLWR